MKSKKGKGTYIVLQYTQNFSLFLRFCLQNEKKTAIAAVRTSGSPIEYHSFWKQEEEALLCAAAKIKGQQKVLLYVDHRQGILF